MTSAQLTYDACTQTVLSRNACAPRASSLSILRRSRCARCAAPPPVPAAALRQLDASNAVALRNDTVPAPRSADTRHLPAVNGAVNGWHGECFTELRKTQRRARINEPPLHIENPVKHSNWHSPIILLSS